MQKPRPHHRPAGPGCDLSKSGRGRLSRPALHGAQAPRPRPEPAPVSPRPTPSGLRLRLGGARLPHGPRSLADPSEVPCACPLAGPGSLTALPFVSPPDISLFDLWPVGSKGKEVLPGRTSWCPLSLVTRPSPLTSSPFRIG